MLDKKGFDLWSKEYDNDVNECYLNNEYPFAGYYDVFDIILSDIKPNSKVLDIGFGTGILTKKIYDKNCRIYGIDFSSEMVKVAKEKMPDALFLEHDFNNPLPDTIKNEKYDYIISTYAIHHLDEDQKIEFIKVLKALLTDNGKIIIGDIAFLTENELIECENKYQGFDKDEFYFTMDSFMIKAEKAGLKVVYTKISHCACIITISNE